MHAPTVLFFLLGLARAAPLNINLGAYSPALVVGDGAISFLGEEQPAPVAGVGGAEPAGEPAEAEPATEEEAPAPAEEEEAVLVGGGAGAGGAEASSQPIFATADNNLQGMGKQRLPKE